MNSRASSTRMIGFTMLSIMLLAVIPAAVQSSQADKAATLIQKAQDRITKLQNELAKFCGSSTSSSGCSDANSNLATGTSDLGQANSMISSANPDKSAIAKLVRDALSHISAAAKDVRELAKDAKAITRVQNVLEPRVAKLQQLAQKVNLNATTLQQVQSLLSQASSGLTNAIQAFQSGDRSAGNQDVKQAIQSMLQAVALIRHK